MDRFSKALRPSLDFWRAGGYQQLVLRFGIGNFGAVGGRYLFSTLGIPPPDAAFLLRAREHVPHLGRAMGDAYSPGHGGAAFVRQRVLAYAEHDLAAPGLAAPLRGAGVHTNGRAHASRWLVPVRPPFHPRADRGTCGEFRMLAGLCDALAQADPRGAADAEARGRFTGSLQVLVSGPCCVSCSGAFAQFRVLFPGVDVRVTAGAIPSALQ